jgi:hypothetical protein
MKTILWLSKHAETHTCRLAASIAVVDRAWGKPSQSHKHRHQLDQQDRPITEVDFVGQVDLRRLSDDELRDFRRQELLPTVRLTPWRSRRRTMRTVRTQIPAYASSSGIGARRLARSGEVVP